MYKKAITHITLGFILFILDFSEDYFVRGTEYFLANFESDNWPIIVTFYLSGISIYFFNFLIICPLFLTKRRFYTFGAIVILLIPLYAGIRFILDEIILFNITGEHNYFDNSRTFWYYIFDNSYYAFKPILLSTVIFLIYQFIDNKKNIYILEMERTKAEVNFLRSQISPHFLFNTLNTFYSSLILTDPKMAISLQRLSDLLRYVTYVSNHNTVELNKEIKFIDEYIFFYKLRFEDQMNVNFKVIGEINTQKIPSLILIHFIENLFKHGKVNDKNSPADITINIEYDFLELRTKNAVLISANYSESGIGSKNIKRRLNAIYDTKFALDYSVNKNTFNAYLKIPLQHD